VSGTEAKGTAGSLRRQLRFLSHPMSPPPHRATKCHKVSQSDHFVDPFPEGVPSGMDRGNGGGEAEDTAVRSGTLPAVP